MINNFIIWTWTVGAAVQAFFLFNDPKPVTAACLVFFVVGALVIAIRSEK